MCILDPKIDRNRGRRRAGIVSCFVVAAIVLPLSISGVWRTQAQAQEKCDKEKKAAEFKEQELKKKEMKMSSEEKIKLSWEKISQNENSAAVVIHKTIEKKGLEAGEHFAQVLAEKKSPESDKYYFKESEINTLGYLYLHGDEVKKAVSVFTLNAHLFPEAWNVYDSLGEAYLAAGKTDKARALYEKSLALNPDNENGKKMLAKIDEKSSLTKVYEDKDSDKDVDKDSDKDE
jgi:tetratricopeptide (TPR) repeat protein